MKPNAGAHPERRRVSSADQPPLGDAARDAVISRLSEEAKRFPDLGLAPLETGGLSGLDAAFAHAIYDAVLRRWMTLEHLLDGYLKQPLEELEPRMQGVLLAGAAQVLLLDKVPPHAAINHAVEWAKVRVREGAGGMVNAVLRKVAGLRSGPRETWTDRRDELPLADGSALGLTERVMPEDEVERLCVATSTPWDLVTAWGRQLGREQARGIALHGLCEAPVILNTAHAVGPLPESWARPHEMPGHHVFRGSREELVELLRSRADVWVQDPASALAVRSVADSRPRLVVDLCAGQGTKTRQLAAVFPEARIVATDADAARLRTLREVFRRSERVQVVEVSGVASAVGAGADLVLLDVPCSNTGVLARRVEARYRFSRKHLESVSAVQRQILRDAAGLLSKGGTVLYSTCSLQEEENRQQAEWARGAMGWVVGAEHRRLPSGGPGQGDERYSDGSYSVRLGPG